MNVAKEFRRLRAKLGLSQQALADTLRVHRPQISDWECGRQEPRASVILRLQSLIQKKIQNLVDEIQKTPDTHSHEEETQEAAREIAGGRAVDDDCGEDQGSGPPEAPCDRAPVDGVRDAGGDA